MQWHKQKQEREQPAREQVQQPARESAQQPAREQAPQPARESAQQPAQAQAQVQPNPKTPLRPWRRVARVVTAIAVAAVAMVGVAYAADAILQTPSYTWYTNAIAADPNATSFTVSTGGDLRGLANLVNGTADLDNDGTPDAAIDFAGKTINQGSFISLANEEFTPIGTQAHPFQGTFAGGAANSLDIRRLQITTGTSYVGLFGYCGAKSSISNVAISNSTLVGSQPANITLKDAATTSVTSDAVIHDVGSVVGYTEGSMTGCSSLATVTVESDREATNADPEVIVNVGGLAGTVGGSVSSCAYLSDLTVVAPSLASDTQDSVVANIGGVVGTLGIASADGRTATAGTINGCTNGYADNSGYFGIGKTQATIQVTTTGVGGLDRFGVEKEACSQSVGGIAGYSYGGITECTNYGLVNTNATAAKLYKSSDGLVHIVSASDITPSTYPDAEDLFKKANGADGVGGIVGTLRGSGVGLSDTARADIGTSGTAITLTQCFNTGTVVGLARTAGLAGSAGSYASIDSCRNGKVSSSSGTGTADDSGHVVSTRWNKPYTAGIVGTTYSSVSNCSNISQIENIQTGYYTSGVVGGLFSPNGYTAECYACFNSGQVHVASYATQSYREAGIVGNNGGSVHDDVMRSGSVLAHDDDGASYPNAAIGDDSWGMWASIKFFSTDDLKKSEAAAVLNASHAQDVLTLPEQSWTYWYIASAGYPTLNTWDTPTNRAMLTSSNVSATCVQLAEYAGNVEAIPSLIVTYTDSAGKQTSLVQNVDYYVIPQSGATAMTNGETPYKASIVGIGNYEGTVSNVCNYGIGACDLANCDVSVSAATYNFGACVYPSAVYVTNPAGAQLASSEYRYEIYSGATYSLTSSKTKNYVVFDSEGYVSWDSGATRQSVSSQHDKLCGDLTGVDYLLYNSSGALIYQVVNGKQSVIDPDTSVEVSGGGPNAFKPAIEGITDGGLAGYVVKVSVKNPSENLKQGSWTTGQYVINSIDLYKDCVIDHVNVTVPSADGSSSTTQTWYWNSEKSTLYSLDANGNPETNEDGSLKQASLHFTGGEIKPETTVTYVKTDGSKVTLPQDRENGYISIYGDPNTTNTKVDYYNRDATPIGDSADINYNALKGHEKAAVTIRSALSLHYSNYVYMYFGIMSTPLSDCSITVAGATLGGDLSTYAYRDGYAVRPTVALSLCGNTLIQDRDYAVTYSNNVQPTTDAALQAYAQSGDTSGLASYTVTGLGNVSGSYTGYFAIAEGKSLSEEGYSIKAIGNQQYNFEYGVQPAAGITLLDKNGNASTLKEGVDYQVSYADNVNVGSTAKVYVYGINGYTGMLTSTFEVVPFDMNDTANSSRISDWVYRDDSWLTEGIPGRSVYTSMYRKVYPVIDWNGSKTDKDIYSLISGSMTLVNESEGTSFSFYVKDIAEGIQPIIPTAGDYKCTIDYYVLNTTNSGSSVTGSDTFEIKVVKYNLAHATWFTCESQTYDGLPHEPVQGVVDGCTVTYADNVNAGIATYTVTAPDSDYYTGTYVGTFVINKLDISKATVSVNNQLYTGKELTPKVTVAYNGNTYTEGTDYTVAYANNTNKGTASVVVTGIGNCEGTAKATFTIGGKLSIAQGGIAAVPDQLYTGSAVTPKPVVTYEGKNLVEGTDYSLSYSNNIEVSTAKLPATITVTGLGTFAGSTSTATFNIVKARDIANATCTIADQTYTGQLLKPSVAVTYDGQTLTQGTDYTVEYRRNLKAGSEAKVVISGTNTFTGTLEVPFNIVVKNGTISEFGADADDSVSLAVQVAKQTCPAGANGVIVVWQKDYANQIAAATLSHATGYPLLLTATDALSTEDAQFIRENGVKSAIIIGSTTQVSASVAASLQTSLGLEVSRVDESTSPETTLQLAKLQSSLAPKTVSSAIAVLSNPTDIESSAAAAAYASSVNAPLYYTNDDGSLTNAIKTTIATYRTVVIAGNTSVIDTTAESAASSTATTVRLQGDNRFSTNEAITSYALQHGCKADGAVFANTKSLTGQLAAIGLCAKTKVPLVLVGTQSCEAASAIAKASEPAYGITVLGDTDAFSQTLRDAVFKELNW